MTTTSSAVATTFGLSLDAVESGLARATLQDGRGRPVATATVGVWAP